MTLRIVFAGTPDFAVPSLRAAAQRNEVVAVYTQPDRPAGRGRELTPSPVKREALLRGIEVVQPENFRPVVSKDALRALKPDLMIVVAYGLILPQSVLDIPTYGCWNVHAALARRRADPACDRSGRPRIGRVPDADGKGPRHRAGAAVAGAGDRRGRGRRPVA